MMKQLIMVAAAATLWTGCHGTGGGDVTFEWFNLSTNEIWVTDVAGLPRDASCGRLTPNRAEDQLEVSAVDVSEAVHIADRITITWKDGGPRGWPGGLKPGEFVPAGLSQQVELNREALGIAAKVNSGRIRFTYLGTNTWRARLITGSGWK